MRSPAPVFLFVAVLLGGCSAPTVRYADKNVRSETLQESVKENHARVLALLGSGTISVETPQMAQSGSFELTLRKPDSVQVKIEGPFGIDVGSALITRERFFFYYSFRNRVIEGPTSPENLSRVFQMPLEFDDVLNLFTGGIFLSEDNGTPTSFEIENDEFVMTYERYTGSRKYWLDPKTMQITKVQFFDGTGKLALEELFGTFRTEGGVTIPNYVRVTMIRERRRISISYSDLAINPPALKFSFEIPGDASRQHVQ